MKTRLSFMCVIGAMWINHGMTDVLICMACFLMASVLSDVHGTICGSSNEEK